MKRMFTSKKAYRLVAIFLICVFQASFVHAQPTIDEVTGQRDETQQQLDEVNATIDELASEQQEIDEQIEEVANALVQVLADMAVLEAEIDNKQQQIDEAQLAYEQAIARANEQYEAMKVRIKYLYECGRTDIVAIYIETGSLSESLTRAEFIEDLYEYDRNMLIKYQETVAEVELLKQELVAEKEEMEELHHSYAEEQASMESVVNELQDMSDSYESQLAEARTLANQYAATIKEQNAQIARLEEQARREAEEAARRAADEAAARAAAQEAARRQAQEVADTGVATVTTTNNVSYDTSSIYNVSGSDLGKSIASYACQFIGNPYVPGGTSLTDGADCSGFVYSVYKNFGYTVPRTSYSLRGAGYEVSYSEAQPGDVVCYPGHVAIYIGNGMIVHASTQRTGIKISNAEYRSITCVRRLI